MESVSPLAFPKPYYLYALGGCFCGPAHLQKVSLMKRAEERCGEARTKPLITALVCFCNDSVSLKAKNTNFSWTQEFLLHYHLWCLQSTKSPLWTLLTPLSKGQNPSGRLAENEIEKVSGKMLMLQVQVVRNHCVHTGSHKNCRHAPSRRLEVAAACCPWPLHCSWLDSFKESQERHADVINLITCHQILWSILDTDFYGIVIWP